MPRAQSIEKQLRKALGKDAADAMLAKIDRMMAGGATVAAIENVIAAGLRARLEQQVMSAVTTGVGPVTPARTRRIHVNVRPVIGHVQQLVHINRAVAVNPGPGRLAKSAKR